jgi:hypothetical protein
VAFCQVARRRVVYIGMRQRRDVLGAFFFQIAGDRVSAIHFDSPGLNQP